ncbi:MAG: type II toxin-antitoxin system prevent-host-death family antitoxin [Crocosphaera sp.]|nr:type II toxin-antitoxin system prevent-host-death family antitoxin [Crocosphaera sp.]
MEQFNYTEIKETLPKVMKKVCQEHSPIIITEKDQEPVVLMSLSDYNSYQETFYLLKSPKNAQRLRDSIAELEGGGGIERELLE